MVLARVGDLAEHVEWTVVLLAVGTGALVWVIRRIEGAEPNSGPVAGAVLIVAVMMRLPLLLLTPTLSDDLLRYVWDGRVAAAGQNPYILAPDADELTPLRDELWQALPHRSVATVYPPLAMGVFSIAARLPDPVFDNGSLWIKSALATADVLGAWALLLVARRRGLPQVRVALYAWSPLVALETAGMGHVDALGVAATVAAVAWLLGPRRQGLTAPLAAAGGVLAKLAPLAAIPMWARHSGRPWKFAAIALGVTAVSLAPVVATAGGVPPGLTTYGVSWEFNGPLYEPLWRAVEASGLVPMLHGGLDRLKGWIGHHETVNGLYPWVYPRLIAKAILAGIMLWVLARSLRRRDPVAGTARLFEGLLLCSATFYPWYALWMMPWAALSRDAAWLTLAALLPLSYLPQFLSVPLMPWVFSAIWVPFFLLRWSSRRRSSQAFRALPADGASPP